MKRPSVFAAWVWAGLVVLGAGLVGLAGVVEGSAPQEAGLLVIPGLYAALGLLIAVKVPGNRIAWLLLVVASGVVVEAAAELRIGDLAPDPATLWDVLAIVWLNIGFFVALVIPLFLLLYLFPTGHFMNRRWAWIGWLAALVISIDVFVELFAEEVGYETPWTITNPIGFLPFTNIFVQLFASVFGIGLVILMVGGIPAIIVRYRRSDSVVRTQIKWVVYSLLLLAIVFISRIFLDLRAGLFQDLLFFLAVAVIPVAITIAITRYRLFEIDRLINRTVVYAIVVAALAGFYAAMVSASAVLLPTTDNDLVIVATVLVAAAAFNPFRRRVQAVVDRRFYRSRYNAERIAHTFTERMRDEVDPMAITEGWVAVVNETLQPETVGVWIKD